ncbi:hypothetical protein H9L15_02010 [Sphingomonas daechungensis]|uniref:Uncharacterized protein n=1 Tax=Sphingomonas daechungensis TaxID=1176646 RepID=A0ABX6T2W0_9SPHN|nr:hypothetical protein [Sphingomonas daechungensis]QNP43558.1 hypothetical protein H9L15_02010 [Sphingomonas daechungensis]
MKSAKKVAKNPLTAEVVAATLVAAAAALRNPKKAQALALEAADDIKSAAKSGVESGTAMWQLALDVARRSMDALGKDEPPRRRRSLQRRSPGRRRSNCPVRLGRATSGIET